MGETRAGMLLLIGLRTSGKSTVGRLIAEEAGCGFVDLDEVVVGSARAEGAGLDSVRLIFEREGEAGFRAREARALAAVLAEGAAEGGVVVALGGGTPMGPGAAEMIHRERQRGGARVVYLRWRAETLAARLDAGDARADRPALGGVLSALEEMRTVFAARDPVYRGLADLVVEGEGGETAQSVAERVLAWWRGA